MAIKNKDLTNSSNDVVKSQLAAAFEKGVAGYGEKGKPSKTFEKEYMFSVNNIDDYSVTGDTSSQVNPNVVNKIASIQIEKEEIKKIRDKLEASFMEDCIDNAILIEIIEKITELPDSNSLKKQFLSLREKIEKEIDSTEDIISAAGGIKFIINLYETSLAKGNLLPNVKGMIANDPVFFALFLALGRSPDLIDPYLFDYGDITAYGTSTGNKHLTSDIYKKLARCLDEENPEILAEKTVTALVVQSLALTEEALDYGVSERFFRRVSGVDPTPESSPDHEEKSPNDAFNDSSGFEGNGGKVAQVIPFSRHIAYQGDEDGPKRLCELFNQFQNVKSTYGPASDISKPAIKKEGSSNNPVVYLPKYLDQLTPKESLLYLSSIISREITLSRGVSEAYSNLTSDGLVKAIKMSRNTLRTTALPVCRMSMPGANDTGVGVQFNTIGKRFLGPSRGFGLSSAPVYQSNYAHDPEVSNLFSVVLRPVPGQETDVGKAFMPLEVLDPKDTENMFFVGYQKNETLKSLVVNALEENPQNPEKPLSIHMDYLGEAEQIIRDANLFFSSIGNVRYAKTAAHGARDNNLGGRIIRRVLDEIAGMIINTGKKDSDVGTGYARLQSTCDLVALNTFFVPSTQATDQHNLLKTEFIRTICRHDVTDNVPIEGSMKSANIKIAYKTDHLLDNYKLGYDPHLKGWLNENNRLLASLHQPDQVADYAPSLHNYSRNYFKFYDNQNTVDKYKYANIGQGWGEEFQENDYLKTVQQAMFDVAPISNEYAVSTIDFLGLVEINASLFALSSEQQNYFRDVMEAGSQAVFMNPVGPGGYRTTITGYDYLNTVFGRETSPGAFHQTLQARILKVVDYIENELNTRTDSNRPPAINGVTLANGMDKAQLITYVLEMFSILSNELVSTVFMKSAYSTTMNIIHGTQIYSSFVASQGNPNYPYAHLNSFGDGFKHIVGVAPKVSGINPNPNFNAMNKTVQNPAAQSISMGDLGQYLQKAAKTSISDGRNLKPSRFNTFSEKIFNEAFGPDKAGGQRVKFFDGFDFAFGETISLRDYQELLRETAEEASFPTIAFSCAADILGYVSAIYYNSAITGQAVNIDADANDLASKVIQSAKSADFSDEVFSNFMKNANLNQIAYANLKRSNIKSSIGTASNYGGGIVSMGVDAFSKHLFEAAMLYLNYAKDDSLDLLELVFFGVTHKAHKDEITKAIAKSSDLNSNKNKALLYDFTFIKNSELDPEISYKRNSDLLPSVGFNLSIFTTYQKIIEGMKSISDIAGNPTAGFLSLVNNTKFYRLNYRNFDYFVDNIEEHTGSTLIEEAEAQGNGPLVEQHLINAVASALSCFLFEAITGFPVMATNISNNKDKSISRSALKIFLEGAKITTSPSPFNFNSDEVIDALFEEDDSSSVLSDAIKITEDENKIKEALTPRLSRQGSEPVLLDPIVSEDVFLLIQTLMKTIYLASESINETILATGVFDAVFGIDATNLKKRFSFTATQPEDRSKAYGSPDIDKLVELQEGDIMIDNYKAVVSRKIQLSDDVGS